MESSSSLFLCNFMLWVSFVASCCFDGKCEFLLIASFDVLVFVCVFVYLKKQAFYFMTYLK